MYGKRRKPEPAKNLELKDTRSEGAFINFLVINPCFDGRADLQWYLHREYWDSKHLDNLMALRACVQYVRDHPQSPPITVPISLSHNSKQQPAFEEI